MADLQHALIPDAQLHEPKGVAGATEGQIYIADGAGSGTWTAGKVVSELVIRAPSYVTQTPTAADTPLQVTFGGGQATTDINVEPVGSVSVNVAGTYLMTFTGSFGRTTSSGTAVLAARLNINGTQALDTIVHELADANTTVPFSFTFLAELAAGTTMTVEVMQDSSGIANGGLKAETLAGPWADAPSAVFTAYKMKVG